VSSRCFEGKLSFLEPEPLGFNLPLAQVAFPEHALGPPNPIFQ
jgi:hypothetical protein